uniref:S4 RNA-binding domain-containing protein n=1 Tax=Syphacia muris TaxID=451379 RepID=A0A0N5AUX2_9BILA
MFNISPQASFFSIILKNYAKNRLLFQQCPLTTSSQKLKTHGTKAEDDGDCDDDGLPKDYKVKTVRSSSRRIDSVSRKVTSRSRTAIEKLILLGKVQVNDNVMKKKSYNVTSDDVVDLWSEAVEGNSSLVYTNRYEVIDYNLESDGYAIKVKYWRKFLVKNWKQD